MRRLDRQTLWGHLQPRLRPHHDHDCIRGRAYLTLGGKLWQQVSACHTSLPLPHKSRLLDHLWHFSVLNALIYVKYDTRHNMQKKKEIRVEKKENILIN